nr:flavin-containing monooxygenase 5-like [Chrysemys picta bellii]
MGTTKAKDSDGRARGHAHNLQWNGHEQHISKNNSYKTVSNCFFSSLLAASLTFIVSLSVPFRFSSVHPTASDNLPNRIISGKVLVKPNIKEFATTSAIFKDGTREENLDVVIFATGYSFSFPFLGDCVKVVENQVSLYKFVFPPHLEKPTLAFIGLIQPFGPLMPIAELRGHWATRVFKGT